LLICYLLLPYNLLKKVCPAEAGQLYIT